MKDSTKFIRDKTNFTTSKIESISNTLTPYIFEERDTRGVRMSVMDRLMMERIIWIGGPINEDISRYVQAQLMYLDSTSKEDITLHIDTPGGCVKSGLSIIDIMNYISSDIITVNTGQAASMGAVILGAGKKGYRKSLKHSRVMMHQSSGGAGGNYQDAEITFKQWSRYNETLITLLAEYTEKTTEQIKNDSSRDFWLWSEEALEYKIIDEII